MHGFALNVNPNMKYFDGMIPCGILDYGVTSISNNINKSPNFNEIISTLIFEFNHIFNK